MLLYLYEGTVIDVKCVTHEHAEEAGFGILEQVSVYHLVLAVAAMAVKAGSLEICHSFGDLVGQ